jgi:hypothetical protein
VSNLSKATFRVLHSLRRREAGEHDLQASEILEAFASEWMLNGEERAALYRNAVEAERQNALKKKG